MLHQELVRLAIELDALPGGVVQVPRLLPMTLGGPGNFSIPGGISGFSVDLEDLRQGPPDLRDRKR